MTGITVRKGHIDDLEFVFRLVQELAQFEKAPDEVVTNVEQMKRDGFGTDPAFNFLVAEFEGEAVGVALYFSIYSTWKGCCLYLDDLIVTEKYRRKGVGKLLFEALLKEAESCKVAELRWQVLDWNTDAIHFYEKYKSNLDSGWINCKLTKGQITELNSQH